MNIKAIIKRFFPHKHKWQTRGVNRFGGPTYQLCLKCRKTQCKENGEWQPCDPIPDLDSQFDENDNFIYE